MNQLSGTTKLFLVVLVMIVGIFSPLVGHWFETETFRYLSGLIITSDYQNGYSRPSIRLSKVRNLLSQRTRLPVEHWNSAMRRTRYSRELQGINQSRVSDLHIDGSMISESQRLERVRSIQRVQVGTASDGVLGRVRWIAIASGERVLGVVVGSHQGDHGGHVSDSVMVSLEDQSSRRFVVAVPVAELLDHLVGSRELDDLFVVRLIVSGPVGRFEQMGGHVGVDNVASEIMKSYSSLHQKFRIGANFKF